jgi:hypothetical protein
MENSEYTKKLENVIRQIIQPIKDIPFNLVIEALTNKRVIRFDDNNDEHKKALNTLIEIGRISVAVINKKGIIRNRPNEVGNEVEIFVKKALNDLGIENTTPATNKNRKKATGYPDILFWVNGLPYYLECKTFNRENISTTQRSFYLSPSSEMKVIYDTIHFCISFEMEQQKRRNKNIFICKSFKILSLEELSLDIKHEFNSDNKRLYSNKNGAKILYNEVI